MRVLATPTIAALLADGDASELIEREGRVVGATSLESYFALVLEAWLSERGIELEAPEYRTVMTRVADEQGLSLMIMTGGHARALARLRPGERALRRCYERFTAEPLGSAGEAMLEWLTIVRRAAMTVGSGSVVVIRLVD